MSQEPNDEKCEAEIEELKQAITRLERYERNGQFRDSFYKALLDMMLAKMPELKKLYSQCYSDLKVTWKHKHAEGAE